MGCCCSYTPTNYTQLTSSHNNTHIQHSKVSIPKQICQPQNVEPICEPLKQYNVNIKAERLNNKIYRIFFINIAREILPILEFKFEFKYCSKPWQSSRIFDCESLRLWKQTDEIFTYIRVPSELRDYNMNIRLCLKFTTNIPDYVSQKWMKYSDILIIKVLSSLITSQFHTGSYVKFRPPNSSDFYYGQIEEIMSNNSSNIDNELLNICTIKDHNGKMWNNLPTKILLQLLADDYIDFCIMDRNYADFELVFRSNKLIKDMNESDNILNEKNEFNIYCSLVECGMNIAQNIYKNDNYNVDETEIDAEGRCFAYNVMKMLIDNTNVDYNMKLNCLKDCGAYLHTKQLVTTVKHRININQEQDWGYGCDICRTSVNEYDYMFHCDNIDELRHDFCVLCAYEMIKKHRELTELLYPILLKSSSLNVFCVDILVSFMVGKVNKFNISH
eukprot:530705_1